MLAEAVYAFAASHKMPFKDTELLMARVSHMLDARVSASSQPAAGSAGEERDDAGDARESSIPVTVDGRRLHLALRPGQAVEAAVDAFMAEHALPVSVRVALLAAVQTRVSGVRWVLA